MDLRREVHDAYKKRILGRVSSTDGTCASLFNFVSLKGRLPSRLVTSSCWLLLLSTLVGLIPPTATQANPAPLPSNASGNLAAKTISPPPPLPIVPPKLDAPVGEPVAFLSLCSDVQTGGELPNRLPDPPVFPVPGEVAEYPLPTVATVALGYGWQTDPNTGKVFFHSGLDLLATTGTPVQAVGAGTVAFAGERGSYGNLVVVNHQGGRQSRYAHLQSVVVRASQSVKQGDLLGTVGSTGQPTSTQPHLHFELRYASSLGWVAEDPSRYLNN